MQNTLNIYLTDEEKDKLKDVLGGVIENIQTGAVSEAIKNKTGSGNPEGGSITYKRFVNAVLQNKGTARQAGAGNSVIAENVIINLDDDKEIIEELQVKDLKLYPVSDLAARRKGNFSKRIIAYLDRKFFTTAKSAGTAYDGEKTDIKDIVDEMIVTAKTVNDGKFVDGVDAEDLCIVLDSAARKAFKNVLDELSNGTRPENGRIGMYDSIEVFESTRLPENTHAFVMLKGAVAEPWLLSDYDLEKIQLDDAYALESFLYSGAGALNPEVIFHYSEAASL